MKVYISCILSDREDDRKVNQLVKIAREQVAEAFPDEEFIDILPLEPYYHDCSSGNLIHWMASRLEIMSMANVVWCSNEDVSCYYGISLERKIAHDLSIKIIAQK